MRPTKSYHSAHDGPRLVLLPRGTSVFDIADRARAAGFVFVSGARYGWARRELATWLVHDYHRAVLNPREPSTEAATAAFALGEGAITRLVSSTRRRVVEMLATAATTWNESAFARDMVDGGLVVGVSDEAGAIGYAPMDRPRLRLVDRVTSLFLSDYLSRPRDYLSLVVCPNCDEVSFSWDEIHEDGCEVRGPRSGLVRKVRRRHATERGTP